MLVSKALPYVINERDAIEPARGRGYFDDVARQEEGIASEIRAGRK
jgi:hypothetical protein